MHEAGPGGRGERDPLFESRRNGGEGGDGIHEFLRWGERLQRHDNSAAWNVVTGKSRRSVGQRFENAGSPLRGLGDTTVMRCSITRSGGRHLIERLLWAAEAVSVTGGGRDRREHERGGCSTAPAAGPAGQRVARGRRPRRGGDGALDHADAGNSSSPWWPSTGSSGSASCSGHVAAVPGGSEAGARKEPSGTGLTIGGARGCDPDNPSESWTVSGLRRRGLDDLGGIQEKGFSNSAQASRS